MDASSGSPTGAAALPTTRLLPIRTPRAAPAEWTTTDDSAAATEEEPVTPTARLMEALYIVVTIGLGSPVNLPVFTAGVAAELARFPRFRSIQVTDGSKDGDNPRWARTAVNVEDHMIVPTLDTAAVEADPDRAVEDYVASLYTLPMDRSRPLWEFHFLDFPTSEAASTVVLRMHHSLGDGMSLITLLLASARSAAPDTPAGHARAAGAHRRHLRAAAPRAVIRWGPSGVHHVGLAVPRARMEHHGGRELLRCDDCVPEGHVHTLQTCRRRRHVQLP